MTRAKSGWSLRVIAPQLLVWFVSFRSREETMGGRAGNGGDRAGNGGRLWAAVGLGLVLAAAVFPVRAAATFRAVLDPAPLPGTWSAASPGPFERSLLLREALGPTRVGRIARGS